MFSLASLRVKIKQTKTKLVKLEDGKYKEIFVGKYTPEEFKKIRMKWGAVVMEAS